MPGNASVALGAMSENASEVPENVSGNASAAPEHVQGNGCVSFGMIPVPVSVNSGSMPGHDSAISEYLPGNDSVSPVPMPGAAPPESYRLVCNYYGKPSVEGHPEIQFSLSHSGEMVVLADSTEPVGVDVEEIRELRLSDFDHFLDEEEKEMIRAAKEPLREFFRIWTVREAFAKEEGIGLSLFEERKYRIDYERELVFFQGKKLHFRTFYLDGHVISLCAAEIPGAVKPRQITREEWREMLRKG